MASTGGEDPSHRLVSGLGVRNQACPLGSRDRLRAEPLHGRSWSGTGAVERVDVSTDGGASWRRARLHDRPRSGTWTRWSLPWTPGTPGSTHLLARATDTVGRTQPDTAVFNTQGYLFDAVVRHPVTVV